ncbi:hypothetical protein KIL84_008700 [Mauremys mutica]|uniref:Uncharacterized protein n=1 Tax=Mauremys mutica TaxID=74926 RepID=A0A9D3X6D4_9SAUR|nr:hypothetical protein KIL84_008700 [Mauremys mutica]
MHCSEPNCISAETKGLRSGEEIPPWERHTPQLDCPSGGVAIPPLMVAETWGVTSLNPEVCSFGLNSLQSGSGFPEGRGHFSHRQDPQNTGLSAQLLRALVQ